MLEIYRKRAGAEISPVEAFEYMVAESFAQHCNILDDEADAKPEAEAIEHEEAARDETPDVDAPVFPWAEAIDTSLIDQMSLFETEGDAEKSFAMSSDYNELRQLVLERDGWQCTYPGCCARKNLEVHHVRFRSRGGPDTPWNLTVVCYFHHKLIHSAQIALQGRAPLALEWTPPKLMREVLERRRNNPSKWAGELDIKEWTLDPAPSFA